MLRKVVRPDKSAVIFKYDGLGRRIEKSITRAGSEKVIPFARKEAAWEESKWETIGGVRIRRPNRELLFCKLNDAPVVTLNDAVTV